MAPRDYFPYLNSLGRRAFKGPLDFRTPEEQFSGEREVKAPWSVLAKPAHISLGAQHAATAERAASAVGSYRQPDRNDGVTAQPLAVVDGSPGMIWGGGTPPHQRGDTDAEEARRQAADNSSHLTDYNDGRVAEVVDDAIASSTWLERSTGRAGEKVRGKGRYIWTRYGWVDLQHVIGAATVTDSATINLVLGLAKEGEQWLGGMKSAFKTEDFLSNWIGAQALLHQQRLGGTIGQAVAHVLAQYRPLTRKEAEDFLRTGGQREDWSW